MRNNILLFFVAFAAAAAITGFAMISFTDSIVNGSELVNMGLSTGSIAGFLLLFLNGTFIKTIYFKRIKAAIAILIAGALLKILHLKFANEVICFGTLVMIIIYFLSFVNKPIKNRLDFLKVMWVIIEFSGAALSILHYINTDYKILSSAIMWLAIIEYLRIESGKRKLQKRNLGE